MNKAIKSEAALYGGIALLAWFAYKSIANALPANVAEAAAKIEQAGSDAAYNAKPSTILAVEANYPGTVPTWLLDSASVASQSGADVVYNFSPSTVAAVATNYLTPSNIYEGLKTITLDTISAMTPF